MAKRVISAREKQHPENGQTFLKTSISFRKQPGKGGRNLSLYRVGKKVTSPSLMPLYLIVFSSCYIRFMDTARIAKNVLLIALGGSGRRTAVTLTEKFDEVRQDKASLQNINLKLISIDFPVVQDNGYFVDYKDHLAILRPETNITECWEMLQKEREVMHKEDEEPWMKVGPISEVELMLARDAQQSGIRRVDYFLLIHMARPRIEKLILDALTTFPKDVSKKPEVSVIIIGSLIGRTGSIVYLPVLKVLESLTTEFTFNTSFSFLYTPKAFEMQIRVENELNYFASLSRIRRYFKNQPEKRFDLKQFLVEESNPLLTSYRDHERPLAHSEIIKIIEKIVEIGGKAETSEASYEEWFRSIPRINTSEIDSMAERYRQINQYPIGNPFSLPQDWNTDYLNKIFVNLESNPL